MDNIKRRDRQILYIAADAVLEEMKKCTDGKKDITVALKADVTEDNDVFAIAKVAISDKKIKFTDYKAITADDKGKEAGWYVVMTYKKTNKKQIIFSFVVKDKKFDVNKDGSLKDAEK